MTPEDFKRHTAERIEASVQNAERALGRKLPRRLAFRWISPSRPIVTEGIEEEVARVAYVDESHIYPCIDIGPIKIDAEGRLVIGGFRAGYAPRPFDRNWKGEKGPFILIYGQNLADTLGG